MPTAARSSASYRGEYPAPKKYALVVSCVDARLLDDTVRFLDHDNLTNRYYHVALPGAALCVCGAKLESNSKSSPPVTPSAWWRSLQDQLLLTLRLTKFELTDVYVIQHRDCGAYREYLKDYYDPEHGSADSEGEEYEAHRLHVEKLRDRLADLFADENGQVRELAKAMNDEYEPKKKPVYTVKTPNVRGFLMDLRGGVELFVAMPGDRLPDRSEA